MPSQAFEADEMTAEGHQRIGLDRLGEDVGEERGFVRSALLGPAGVRDHGNRASAQSP